ncbi:MAG: hypothetical protein J2P16_00310 [Mycobacterium sp.]|nr:hypothetical protein [Mycobacterium sp.]
MWKWLLADTHGTPQVELTTATSRQVSWNYRAAASATFHLPGDAHEGDANEALYANELISDVLVYHDQNLVFRGRVGAVDETLEVDKHDLTVSVVDYRTMLSRRFTATTDTAYSNVDPGDVAWALIHDAQAWPGGNLGITRGAAQHTGRIYGWTVPASKPIDEAITDALAVFPGGSGEWWIDPQLRLQVPPQRGADKGERLIWGTNVTKLDRKWNPDEFANVIVSTGKTGDSTTPGPPTQVVEASDVATRPEGRIAKTVSNTDLTTAQQVLEAGQFALGYSGNITPAWTVTLSEWGGFSHIDVGDLVWLVVKSGRLDVNQQLRVTQIDVSLDDNDDETVQVTLGGQKEWLGALLKQMPRQLAQLART